MREKKHSGYLCKYHRQVSGGAVFGGCKHPEVAGACISCLPCRYYERRVHRKKSREG
jgi:hypothetical protein